MVFFFYSSCFCRDFFLDILNSTLNLLFGRFWIFVRLRSLLDSLRFWGRSFCAVKIQRFCRRNLIKKIWSGYRFFRSRFCSVNLELKLAFSGFCCTYHKILGRSSLFGICGRFCCRHCKGRFGCFQFCTFQKAMCF